MAKKKFPKFIKTVAGRAKYVKTEIEDKLGRWNDDYATKYGYWVIHEGKQHHIYLVMGKNHAKHIAGGYFQQGCFECAHFIKEYGKRRPWRKAWTKR